MNKPHLVTVDGKPEFFNAVSYEVEAIFDAVLQIALPVCDLRGAHRDRQLAALKINADDVAKRAGQIVILAKHLSGVCEKTMQGRES